jgi:hypothetical protein
MDALRLSDRVLATSVAITIMTACGGLQPPIGAPGAMTQSQTSAASTHAKRGASWMLPEAKGDDLLYVSGPTDSVYIYSYSSRKPVGTLTGFSEPYGQCVDKTGNIWITNYGADNVLKFAHGGTSVLRTLNTKGQPVGCSVAPNGNLAVAVQTGYGVWAIEVFKKKSGTGITYKNDHCAEPWTPGYDLMSNLYFEGKKMYRYRSYTVHVCELPAGASAIRRVSFNKKIVDFGAVMWDGRYVALADTTNTLHTYVYQAKEASSGDLMLKGTTEIVDRKCPSNTWVLQTYIVGKNNTPANNEQGNTILGGNRADGCYTDFDGWAYPSGKPAWALNIRYARGESVSLTTRH